MVKYRKLLVVCIVFVLAICGCGGKKNADITTETISSVEELELSSKEVTDLESNTHKVEITTEKQVDSETEQETEKEAGINTEKGSQNEQETETIIFESEDTTSKQSETTKEEKTTKKKINTTKKEETTAKKEEETTVNYDDPLCNLMKYDEYYKYEYAYKYKDTSKLKGDEITFYNNLKEALDYAESFSRTEYKAKAIHDWIILHIDYDQRLYSGDMPRESYYPEGVFINSLAVCNGYATSFQLCMDILGIPCDIVTGSSRESGGGHAWNRYQLDGEWYQIDLTWDDMIGFVGYKYFNLTDEHMLDTHIFNPDPNKPCNSYKYSNVYFYEGLFAGTQAEFDKELLNAINNNVEKLEIAVDVQGVVNFAEFEKISEICGKDIMWRIGLDGMRMWYGGYVVMYVTFIERPDNLVIANDKDELIAKVQKCVEEKQEKIFVVYNLDDEPTLYQMDSLINGNFRIKREDEPWRLAADDYFCIDNTGAIYNSGNPWYVEYNVTYWD